MPRDPRLAGLLEQIMQLSSGDLSVRGQVGNAGDDVDALVAALNMLAEDFSEREKNRVEAENRTVQVEREHQRLSVRASALQRSNVALSEFALVASHDLQEPLRMIASYTELLENRYGERLGPEGQKYVRFAAEGARRMQRLVADLLTYCQIGADALSLGEVDTTRVVSAVLRDLAAAVEAAGAEVRFSGLPVIIADARQLQSVFLNLIGNAIKYRSEAPPVITITAETRGGGHCFAVTDNGIGVAPEFSKRVFEVFQRLHNRKRYEGSGVGLAICRKVIEAHGGSIWVEPALPKGSVFRFELPRSPSSSPRQLVPEFE